MSLHHAAPRFDLLLLLDTLTALALLLQLTLRVRPRVATRFSLNLQWPQSRAIRLTSCDSCLEDMWRHTASIDFGCDILVQQVLLILVALLHLLLQVESSRHWLLSSWHRVKLSHLNYFLLLGWLVRFWRPFLLLLLNVLACSSEEIKTTLSMGIKSDHRVLFLNQIWHVLLLRMCQLPLKFRLLHRRC